MNRLTLLACLVALSGSAQLPAADPKPAAIYARDNLVAWCIVPFDAKKRTPEERAAMMKKLGFKKFAYDWRGEHLPTFEREIAALKKEGIELTAVWFPAGLGKDAQTLLDALKKHEIKTQLWVTMDGGGPAKTPDEQAQKVRDHARAIKPIADEAAKIGCTVALYNHGGWFGEPENQIAIIEELKLKNVGIVYNLHHGHDQLDRLPVLIKKIKPHLLAFNLNGMIPDGERKGKKIIPLGQGSEDLKLMKLLADSGWSGPVGILGHTSDDAEDRLKDNLDGFDWLLPQLGGKEPGPKPTPKTYKVSSAAPAPTAGWVAAGRKLFGTLGCAKCHAVTADQPGGGAPSLAEAGKRFTPAHVAESVLLPDRVIAAEFRGAKILTLDGQVFIGLVIRETPTELELLLPDTKRKVVKVAYVEQRTVVAQSPMPAGLVKNRDELRDLITYLLSDRPLPP